MPRGNGRCAPKSWRDGLGWTRRRPAAVPRLTRSSRRPFICEVGKSSCSPERVARASLHFYRVFVVNTTDRRRGLTSGGLTCRTRWSLMRWPRRKVAAMTTMRQPSLPRSKHSRALGWARCGVICVRLRNCPRGSGGDCDWRWRWLVRVPRPTNPSPFSPPTSSPRPWIG
ncbi:MAG: hypothetical protein JWN40_4869 [Phycisphaerales bacterium]|nr:hypothetical protein [Phycisphaerales bacterium]